MMVCSLFPFFCSAQTHARTHACKQARTHARVHTHTHSLMHSRKHARTHGCTHARMQAVVLKEELAKKELYGAFDSLSYRAWEGMREV